MYYPISFKTLVEQAAKNNDFVGFGNPNSKILIIGKEVGQGNENVVNKTVKENAQDWLQIISNELIEFNDCQDDSKLDFFNPLIPYKGMKKKQQSVGHTWRKYQRIHELLTQTNSDNYSFLDACFITELNDNPSKTSNLQNNKSRLLSIQHRVDTIFKSEFIQSFPIVILNCGHYIRENNIDICSLFGVDYYPHEINDNNNKSQWYNLHYNKKELRTKIVIHTRHLSMNVTNNLINSIANEIAVFTEKEHCCIY